MLVAAALDYQGVIYTGKRHYECIYSAFVATGRPVPFSKSTQGFVTDDGTFLTRKEAAEHAYECGQIKERKDTLFSEDLW